MAGISQTWSRCRRRTIGGATPEGVHSLLDETTGVSFAFIAMTPGDGRPGPAPNLGFGGRTRSMKTYY